MWIIYCILQLNISGCDCVPEDCEQTNNEFQQLTQLTEHCFADYNLPINDVANKIHNDAKYLRTIIEQLYNQNPHGKNFGVETKIKVESEWCHY